ncbi:MAG: GNAT family N-acetyltransferase [Rubrivivax sp.]
MQAIRNPMVGPQGHDPNAILMANPNDDVLNAALPTDRVRSSHAARSWVPIRTLTPPDRTRVLEHLLALDTDDRVLRFGHVASDDRIARYVEQLDFERDLIFGVFDRSLRLVAQAHLAFGHEAAAAETAGDVEAGEAEFSLSVLPRSRGQGMGSLLFDHAVTAARNRGVRRLWIHLLRENAAMLAIVRRSGAQIDFDGVDATAQLQLPAESLLSRIDERIGHRAAELDYRRKLRELRIDLLKPAAR